MERHDKNNIIIALLVINLVAVLFFSYRNSSAINLVERSVMNEIANLRWEVADMDNQVSERFEELIAEQNNKVDGITFEISDVNSEALEARVLVKVQLKEKEAGTKIQLMYSYSDREKTLTLQKSGLLTYEGIVTLSLKENYEWTVMETGEDSARLLNDTPAVLFLAGQYYENRGINSNGSGSYGSEDFYMEDEFTFDLLSADSMGPERVEMILMNNGEVIKTIDVTDDFLLGGDMEALYHQRDKDLEEEVISDHNSAYAGSSSSSASSRAVRDSSVEVTCSGQMTTLYGLYYFHGTYKEYGLEEWEQLDAVYRITYKDGYVQEL